MTEPLRHSRGGSGFANARFETDIEEGLDVLEEYYPEQERSFLVEQQASHEGIAAEYQSCELSTVELSSQLGKSINGF